MSASLDDQLAAYGSWLRQTCDADLTRPVGTGGETGEVIGPDREIGRRPARARRWLQIAAALLVVVGIGGLVIAQREEDPPAAVARYTSPTDPPAHLFVLPTDTRSLVLENGAAFTARPDRADTGRETGSGVLIGTEQDDGFSNLVDVQMTSADPSDTAFGNGGPSEIETATGPALVADGGLLVQRVAQQRGDDWLVLTGTDETQTLIEVLENVTIDPAGSLAVQDNQRTVIAEFSYPLDAVDYSTYYEATDPDSGITFIVETATAPSAVALGAYTSDAVMPTTVNGTQAWIMSRGSDPPEGDDTAFVWRASPNRVIAVSAHTDTDAVRAVAEQLEQVTEEQWFTALPGATNQD